MKKLLLPSIFLAGIAFGSEQPNSDLSNAQTAQLLANFANLPEEIKCIMFPEYSPELLALVYLKPIPQPSKDNAKNDQNYYWKNLLKPSKKVFQYWDLSYGFLKNQRPYFLYHSFPKYNTKLRRLGPNKNNILLLDTYLYDYSSDCKQLPYLRSRHSQQSRSDLVVSSNAQDLKHKYLSEQFFTCIHPEKNLFVGIPSFDPKLSVKRLAITVSNYDSVSKKIDVQTVDVPARFEFLSFDTNNLDVDALWAVDSNRKLWHLDKVNNFYKSTLCGVKDVYTISQSRVHPHLLLINGKSLYKIEDASLKWVKTFEHETTFAQDKLSLEEGYLVQTKKQYALIIKPLETIMQQAKQVVAAENKLKILKQRMTSIHQVGRNLL